MHNHNNIYNTIYYKIYIYINYYINFNNRFKEKKYKNETFAYVIFIRKERYMLT